MNDNLNQYEKLSALADGLLQDDELAQALDFAGKDEGQEAWQIYHLVGDVLRSPELVRQADRGEFLAQLRQQLAQEPSPHWEKPPHPPLAAEAAHTKIHTPTHPANDPVFRWKMVAGLASMAAVATFTWSLLGGMNVHSTGAQMAAVTPSAPVVAGAERQAPQIMIRDPRLDELLAAHKQFGGASALQLPAGFLRNATFESPSR